MSNIPPPNFQMGGPPSRHPAPGRKTLLNTPGMPPQHSSSGPGGHPVPGRHFDGPGQSHHGPPPSQREPHYMSHPDQLGLLPDSRGMRVEIRTIQEIAMGEVLLLPLQEGAEEATLDHMSY